MKSFLIKIFLFLLPIELIIVFHLFLDPFRIVYEYEDYYKNNFVAVNRGEVCFRTFTNNREEQKFDSFIFGSSRSQAFKCVNWEKYLSKNSKAFHFDASGEGLFGIQTKISYLDEIGDKINNALIILDEEMLGLTSNNVGYFVASPPQISKESTMEYYSQFIKAGFDIPFLVGYLDYSLFGTYRSYMEKKISRVKYNHKSDPINGDIFYGNEIHIKEDSSGYYNNLIEKGIFYERSPLTSKNSSSLTERAILQLKTIKSVFEKHKTNFKIIISPLYDQIPLDITKEKQLSEIFGKENIFNYSGKNELTEPVHNFYENSHYRPKVANKILDKIYN